MHRIIVKKIFSKYYCFRKEFENMTLLLNNESEMTFIILLIHVY